ncbi:alpha/beta fold hydrolase [Novosphingobium sp. SG707]|uniref:alpha/beta fold hydrolase n=1 Tax=Novosphingobium sp. SG707 TaxID=2586996 RepID=UPI001448178E|nr:alpha/beta fold hydrolase [Novosphingobium sp. SG707]NKI98857.1 2-hydroxy-6-oxonona-2,4-dienedioate hydrolase [Novosphingobium sp. SG707]
MTPAYSETSTSQFVDVSVDGAPYRIHYNDIGAGQRAVVMLHGSGPGATGWANFNRNIDPFVAAGYRVLLINCPGWGQSDPVVCTGSRSELNAEAVKGVLDALGIEKADLVGNSMGGHSAVAFALANPARAGKLVLMGGGTGGPSLYAPMPTEGIKLLQGLYRDPTIEKLKAMMNVFVYDASALTEAQMQMRLDNMRSRLDHLENFVKSLAANPRQFPDQNARLHEIAAPTLIVWGRDDRFVPMDVGLRLLAGIPNSQLHVFARCGHWAQWEHADVFNEMVLNFLSR